MYGMVANIPDKSIVDDFIVEFFSEMYKLWARLVKDGNECVIFYLSQLIQKYRCPCKDVV